MIAMCPHNFIYSSEKAKSKDGEHKKVFELKPLTRTKAETKAQESPASSGTSSIPSNLKIKSIHAIQKCANHGHLFIEDINGTKGFLTISLEELNKYQAIKGVFMVRTTSYNCPIKVKKMKTVAN